MTNRHVANVFTGCAHERTFIEGSSQARVGRKHCHILQFEETRSRFSCWPSQIERDDLSLDVRASSRQDVNEKAPMMEDLASANLLAELCGFLAEIKCSHLACIHESKIHRSAAIARRLAVLSVARGGSSS